MPPLVANIMRSRYSWSLGKHAAKQLFGFAKALLAKAVNVGGIEQGYACLERRVDGSACGGQIKSRRNATCPRQATKSQFRFCPMGE